MRVGVGSLHTNLDLAIYLRSNDDPSVFCLAYVLIPIL